jgi:hypothetical protein
MFAAVEFTDFLKNAIYYIRTFVRAHLAAAQDHACRNWQDVPPSLLRHIGELNKEEHLQTDRLLLKEYKKEAKDLLQTFSTSYCFMLLFMSREKESRSPAKERYRFEVIQSF